MLKRLTMNWLLVFLFLLTAALGVAAVGKLTSRAVEAAPQPAITSAHSCTINGVAVVNSRIHVQCSNSYSIPPYSIIYFAYPTSDSAGASRFLSLFLTAKATGSSVTVYFDSADTSGSAFGCAADSCRKIWGASTP